MFGNVVVVLSILTQHSICTKSLSFCLIPFFDA